MDSHEKLTIFENSQHPKRHALHIPEIADMVASHMTSIDILICRGVCKEWRQIFSPFLKLHAIYWNNNANNVYHKARFEERLETLGHFVQSLKQVYPIQSDLERIKRTCFNLRRIGFFLRDRTELDTQAIMKFFQDMTSLERVEVYSHYENLMAACLMCLASFQVSSRLDTFAQQPRVSYWPEKPTTERKTPPVESLKGLELGISAHLKSFSCMDWHLLEAVLKRHRQIQELTLHEAHLREDDKSWTPWFYVGSATNQQVQRSWGDMVGKLTRMEGSGQNVDPGITTPAANPVVFNYLETLVLDKIQVSEELFANILCRCPALKTLTLRLTKVEISMNTLSRCLPSCTQLSTVTVNNEYGGLCIDITKFWAFIPALKTCLINRNLGPGVHFSELESNPSLYNSVIPQSLRPGANIVFLELSISISIADEGVLYIMTNCCSLVRLVLRFHYFLDWEQHTEQPTSYPEWSCGLTLKTLELQTIYRRHDHQVDERAHLFMSRLGGLKVLEKFILPAKLLSDLSESGGYMYTGFLDLLVRLDLRDEDHSSTQRQLATTLNPTWSSGSDTTELHLKIPQELSEQSSKPLDQIWPRNGTGPVNFIPQMPSVKEVVLTSPSGFKFPLEMRYLHILMEGLPGLKKIWTSMDLYGMDCIPRFKYMHSRFQEFYNQTGVELNLVSHRNEYDP
ncbi:hypothetical protein BGZ76_006879 [Entomortierella beljakovae]|nr:hypothetical protein BGZ76_006879 [Entomortierella beljakovae]